MHQILKPFTNNYQRRTLVAIAQYEGLQEEVKTFLEINAGRVDTNNNLYHLWASSVRHRVNKSEGLEVNIALDFTARTEAGLIKSMGIILEAFPHIFQEYASIPDPLFQLKIGTLKK